MKIVALVQARMSSSRLPNKVLLPLEGKTVLEHIYCRLTYSTMLTDIIVVTSNDKSDQSIVELCKKKNIKFFQGNLYDVLDRYYKAANHYNADAIVRITGDCPVIDPSIVDEVVNNYLNGDFDFYSLSGEFPDGLDCQVFKYSALKKSWKEAKLASDREHVGTYIEKTCPKLFKIGGLVKFKKLSHHRWTIDEKSDYIFLKELFSRLFKEDKPFLTKDILNLLSQEPELMKINNNITRNAGYLQSLENERK
tara:strand:- start:344 stop:1096 length:753 start_codon:yes stop_codon:yes gene_type:complete